MATPTNATASEPTPEPPGDPQASDVTPDPAPAPGARLTTVTDAARTLAAVAMLGAAIIHFAFAPDHLSEQTSHGVFFLVVGWSQLLGAAALAFRWRPQRAWLLGTAAVNAAVAALWLLTRTAGLPGEEAEAVGFPDALASGLEVIAAVSAVAVALGWLAEREVRRPTLAVTGLPAIAMVAVVTASVVPSLGGGHAHGGDGHDGGHDTGSGEAAAGHAHGGAAEGESAGADAAEDWNAQRIAALTGYLPDDEVARVRQVNVDYLAE